MPSPLAYLVPGAIVWFGTLRAGIHPTIAGVVLGLLTPVHATPNEERAPVISLQESLHSWAELSAEV